MLTHSSHRARSSEGGWASAVASRAGTHGHGSRMGRKNSGVTRDLCPVQSHTWQMAAGTAHVCLSPALARVLCTSFRRPSAAGIKAELTAAGHPVPEIATHVSEAWCRAVARLCRMPWGQDGTRGQPWWTFLPSGWGLWADAGCGSTVGAEDEFKSQTPSH